MPWSDWLSICSISLTVVVSIRSSGVTIRADMSAGESPAYCQATAITGMRISGKMSTGVRSAPSIPAIAITMAITMKVNGRVSATRTIWIMNLAGSWNDWTHAKLQHQGDRDTLLPLQSFAVDRLFDGSTGRRPGVA